MALVFIVEDDNDIRQIEAYALKCGGFEIEEFEDAKALYERLEKKAPDLFLLDAVQVRRQSVLRLEIWY